MLIGNEDELQDDGIVAVGVALVGDVAEAGTGAVPDADVREILDSADERQLLAIELDDDALAAVIGEDVVPEVALLGEDVSVVHAVSVLGADAFVADVVLNADVRELLDANERLRTGAAKLDADEGKPEPEAIELSL